MDAKQLEKMMGFAPGELKKAAEAYEKDEWPKGRTIKLGRPPISDEGSVEKVGVEPHPKRVGPAS